MSNSYKKSPVGKATGTYKRIVKRQASKAVRHFLKNELNEFRVKSKDYRKIYDPWDINDHIWTSFTETDEDFVKWNHALADLYPYWKKESKKDLKYKWFKLYRRK